jgi:hypothetical protein
MDIYREKYLKYKKKYLELQQEKNLMKNNGFNSFSNLFSELNLLLKTNFNFEMNPNRTSIDIPNIFRNLNMYFKFGNIKDGNKLVFNQNELDLIIKNITEKLEHRIKLFKTKAVILKDNDNYRLSINKIQIGGAQTFSIELVILIITNEKKEVKSEQKVDSEIEGEQKVDSEIEGEQKVGFEIEGEQKVGFEIEGEQKVGFEIEGEQKVGFEIEGEQKVGFEIEGEQKVGFEIEGYQNNLDLIEFRKRNLLILNNKIAQEKNYPIHHIQDYSLINKELTKNQLRLNKLFFISAHGVILRDDDIRLKPGQRVISLKYFTLYYELPIVVLRFIFPLFREWPAFDILSFLTQLGGIKIGDQRLDSKFYRKYGIYDGNIEESSKLPNMIFTPLEQIDIKSYLFKEMWNNETIKKKINLNFEENLTLFHLDGGIKEVPISFTHKITGKKLDLSKIFDFKRRKINLKELSNHKELFQKNGKLTLNGNSNILRIRYTTPQFYISPHLFRDGITLRNIIDRLEARGINEFTIFISSCKELSDIEISKKYRYFDLKEYMESLRESS